jgi:hypothetical protein
LPSLIAFKTLHFAQMIFSIMQCPNMLLQSRLARRPYLPCLGHAGTALCLLLGPSACHPCLHPLPQPPAQSRQQAEVCSINMHSTTSSVVTPFTVNLPVHLENNLFVKKACCCMLQQPATPYCPLQQHLNSSGVLLMLCML